MVLQQQHGHDAGRSASTATTAPSTTSTTSAIQQQEGGKSPTTRGVAIIDARESRLAEVAASATIAAAAPQFEGTTTLFQEVRLWNGYMANGLGGRLDDDHEAFQRQQQQLDVYNLEYLAEPFRPTVMQVADWHGELPREPKMFR